MDKKVKNRFVVALVSIFSLSTILVLSHGFITEASVSVDPNAETEISIPPKSTRATSSSSSPTTPDTSSSSEATQESEEVVDTSVLNDSEELYQVNAGQSLWEIAQETGTNIQDLMKKNNLTNSLVFAGQYLIVNH